MEFPHLGLAYIYRAFLRRDADLRTGTPPVGGPMQVSSPVGVFVGRAGQAPGLSWIFGLFEFVLGRPIRSRFDL